MSPKEQALKMAKEIIERSETTQDAISVAGILLAAGIGILSGFAKQGKLTDLMLLALIEDLTALQKDLTAVLKKENSH